MKILDVYSNYIHDMHQKDSPDLHRKRVKLYDTVTVARVVYDQQKNKGLDMKIDDELRNFFDYDIIILPFVNKKEQR